MNHFRRTSSQPHLDFRQKVSKGSNPVAETNDCCEGAPKHLASELALSFRCGLGATLVNYLRSQNRIPMRSPTILKKDFAGNKSGATLIIVVLFMVLLVGLATLFLMSAISAVQLSNSSVSEEKATNIASGGSDIIIGDLRQEIADGSNLTTYSGSGSKKYFVYQPKSFSGSAALSTAVPAVVGFVPQISNGVESDGLANLVKISQNGTPFYSSTTNTNYTKTGITRASAVSTTAPALDGRVITSDRWNSHYLIQRPAANQGLSLNSTPVSTFPNPDWIIFTRSGAQKAFATTDLPNLADSTNSQYAIGRFAYAVYNEGGVLDMNAAGYPSSLTPQQTCQKGSLAFSDLTQLGLTQNQVDQIVGWRNPYTAQLGAGSQFGSIAFNSTSSTSWVNNFAIYNNCQTNTTLPKYGLKNGFMTVNETTTLSAGLPSAPSDQMFVSRSQLISLVESLGVSPDVLQYMGTFSRSIEQPSYAPNAARPLIINPTIPPPAAGGSPNETTYAGNNDAAAAR